MPDQISERSSVQIMEMVVQILKKEGGRFVLAYDEKHQEWAAGLEWGQETPDSPYYSAAAYGISSNSPAEAINQALDQTGMDTPEL